MGFIRDFVTAVDSVLNWLNFLSLAALHSFSFLGLPAAGRTAKVPVLRPRDIWAPTVRPVPSWHSRETTLHCWHTHGVPGLPWEAFCWELALGGYMPILHLGMYEAKRFTPWYLVFFLTTKLHFFLQSCFSSLCVKEYYCSFHEKHEFLYIRSLCIYSHLSESTKSRSGILLKFILQFVLYATLLWFSFCLFIRCTTILFVYVLAQHLSFLKPVFPL